MGLGNVWRFSSVVGQNGGGAYLLPYLLAAFLFAVPMLILELSVGRAKRMDVIQAFANVEKRLEPLGWLLVGAVLVILSYYLVLTGWVLAYAGYAALGSLPSFTTFTSTWLPLPVFLVAALATAAIVASGVRGGIERMAKVVMPTVFLLLIALALYGVTLDGFGPGVSFLFPPDLSVLGDPLVWSAAFGQVFFSLSVGQGIMLTYGAYLDDHVRIPRAALTITVADILVALVAGVVIFPLVFTLGVEPSLGTELAFTTLPQAFAVIPGGAWVGLAFFSLLFFAALSSSVSLLEVGVASLTRASELSRPKATWALTGGVVLLGTLSALSYSPVQLSLDGVRVLDLLDDTVGTLALPITAVILAVVFTWLPEERDVLGWLEASWLVPVVKYLIPSVLLVTTLLRLVTGVGLEPWSLIPGHEAISSTARGLVLVGILILLVMLGRLIEAWVDARRRTKGPGASP